MFSVHSIGISRNQIYKAVKLLGVSIFFPYIWSLFRDVERYNHARSMALSTCILSDTVVDNIGYIVDSKCIVFKADSDCKEEILWSLSQQIRL